MTCQNLGVLCVLWSFVMTSVIWSHPADTKPRLVPPEIIEGPNFHEFFQINNDKKDLPCDATGTPPIQYNWLFNGAELNFGDRTKIVDGHLYIHNPTSDMEGYYQCLASNEAGVAMSNISFLQAAVFESLSPRDRTSTRNLSVKQLDHLVLPCNHIIRSVPRDNVTWELSTDGGINFRKVHLNNHIAQAQNGSLVFSVVWKNNSAIYKCNSYNKILLQYFGGSRVNLTIESEDLSVIVRKLDEPPVLLYASPDVTILDGEEMTLQCLFGGWPGHEVEWTTPSSARFVNHTLVISNMSSADAGVYSCRARKIHSHLQSSQVNISVQVDAIPSFDAPLYNQEVPESGRDVTFRCQGRGRPTPKVTWYTNGITVDKLEDDLDHSISGDGTTSVLALKNIRTSATVTCNISNAHGYRLQSAVVTIGAPKSDADNISSSSSHDVIFTSQITSKDKQTSTTSYQTTTQAHRWYTSSTTSYDSGTTITPITIVNGNDRNNTNNSPAGHAVENPMSSTTTTIITVGAVVVVALVLIVVAIIIRRRRQRGSFSLPEQDQPLRLEEVRIRNEQVYDSDDSGFDDSKAECERRALQGHQPSS